MKTRLLILLFVCASLAHAQIPTDGLVGCYLFAGGTNDTSGNANDLTNYGAMLAADRFGTPASAYQFDGWSSHMLSSIPTLPAGNSARTISAFFKTPTPQVTDQYIVGWGAQASDQDWYLDVNNGNLRLVAWNDDIILTPITADTWYHFAATYDDSTITVYVNGRAAKSGMHHLNTDTLGYLSVGAAVVNDTTFTGYFKGFIDDICIYNRALSALEISSLYHAKPGASMFDGSMSSAAHDSTSAASTYDSLANAQANVNVQSNTQLNSVPSADATFPEPPSVGGAQYDQADPQGFQAALSPYGEWVNAGLGYGWRPLGTGAAWRPYLYGRWEWTDYGWYWVSSEPFGWATYHYGRWYLDDFYGWVWIPGATWGPAWVEWRSNDSYIGWAPLTPAAAYTSSGMIIENTSWSSPAPYWTFVSYGNFSGVSMYDHVEPVARYHHIIATSHRSVIATRGGRVVNAGVDVRVVDHHIGKHVPRVVVVEGNQAGGDKVIRGSGSQRIQVFRPKISRMAVKTKANPSGNSGQDQSGSAPAPTNQDQPSNGSGDNGGGRDVNASGGGAQPAPAPVGSAPSPITPAGSGGQTYWPTATPGTRIISSPASPAKPAPSPTGNGNQGGGSSRHVDNPPPVKPPDPVVQPPVTPSTPPSRYDQGRRDESPKKIDPVPATPPAQKMHLHLHKHKKAAEAAPAPTPAPQIIKPAPQVIKPAPAPKIIKPEPTHH